MDDKPRGLSGKKVTRMLMQVGDKVAVGDAGFCRSHFGDAAARS